MDFGLLRRTIAALGMKIRSEQEKETWNALLKRALREETLDVPDVGCGIDVLSLPLSALISD